MVSLYEKFHITKQDKEKLRIAVALCLHGGDGEAPDVERYLRLRQRAAAEFLIRRGDLTGMRRLAASPWFEKKYIPDYLRMAQEAGRAEFIAELLREWYGMREKECGAEDKETEYFFRRNAAAENSREKDDAGRTAREIVQLTIQSLQQRFPFLGGALLALEPVEIEKKRQWGNWHPVEAEGPDGTFVPWGTDGEKLYYEPGTVCSLFRQDSRIIESLTLHSLFHCLFGHIFLPWADREEADRMVDGQLSRMTEEEERKYTDCGGAYCTDGKCVGPKMQAGQKPGNFRVQDNAVSVIRDCHDFWPSRREGCTEADAEHTESLRCRWKRLAAGGGAGGMGLVHGQNGGGLSREYGCRKRKIYDYRRFLEQFMVRREERLLDMENFDPIWYHYSRGQYEGLVLLEPLETREVTRLEEILIAIDTSASCSGEVVERFLDETFAILERQEHFFHRMNVHIVQCDCMIQDHVRITCERQWRSYRENLKIRGLGDTDFTPVFTLAGELERSGRVKNLKGILYFTDGDGIFPRKAPPWPSAFVFLDRELEKHELPDWAIRLNLSES